MRKKKKKKKRGAELVTRFHRSNSSSTQRHRETERERQRERERETESGKEDGRKRNFWWPVLDKRGAINSVAAHFSPKIITFPSPVLFYASFDSFGVSNLYDIYSSNFILIYS